MSRLQARRIYGSPFEFDPHFKLFIDANHKPVIRGTDNAIWRRIHLIPFNVSIPKNEQDPDLGNKLRTELPGILAWAVRGCLKWRQEELRPPKTVTDAVDQYRNQMDVVGDFVAECCRKEPATTVAAADLYAAYRHWSQSRGDEVMSETKFGTRLGELGFEGARQANVRARKGLQLVVEPLP
jgi:putative DNA primase/helicase